MVGIIILAVIAVFLAVVLIRTAMFKPKEAGRESFEDVSFDGEAAVNALAELIRCRTVSYDDHSLEDDAEFEKLIGKLPVLYPHVMEKCSLKRFPDRGLLFKWDGREPGDPAVLMAHYDVVPVEEENWDKPAFEGIIEDGVLWGRGALDTKVTFNGVLSAAENLIKQGFQPKNDIYFAFSGGEEVNGRGAVNIVDYFTENGIVPSMVVEYSVGSNGGHASAPAPHTPVGVLAKACVRIENHPFKAHFTKPVMEMFDTLGRHSTFVYRMIFANLWCFGGVLDSICKKSGGELNALVRTTVAFTQMNGSKASNVIPPSASMVSNMRLNPEDTMDSALEYLRSVVGDESVKITKIIGENPSPISRTDCEGWQRVVNAVSGTWRGSIVSPYLMVQCSDSRHYRDLSDKVYRFSAMDLTAEERHTIHGNNERIRVDTAKRAVEFYVRLMKQC